MEGIVTAEDREVMLANGLRSIEDPAFDPAPVVRVRAVDGPQTWLLTEIDPLNPDLAYGLCDLGVGTPETGVVSIAWLSEATGPLGLRLEREPAFSPPAGVTLSMLARIAEAAGRIVI